MRYDVWSLYVCKVYVNEIHIYVFEVFRVLSWVHMSKVSRVIFFTQIICFYGDYFYLEIILFNNFTYFLSTDVLLGVLENGHV